MKDKVAQSPPADLPELELVVKAERRRTILFLLPLLIVATGSGAVIITRVPYAHAFDPWMFGLAAVISAVNWVLLYTRRMSETVSARWTVSLLAIVVGLRVASVFTGASSGDPNVSLFYGIFAFFPLFFTFTAILFPWPQSGRYNLLVLLLAALFTTYFCLPFFGQTPPRQGLGLLMSLVWLGYPMYALTMNSFSRSQQKLMLLQADAAAAARAATRMAEQSAERFASVFNQAAVGIGVLDRSGRWLKVNEAMCKLSGYGEAEMQAHSFQFGTHPDDLAQAVDLGCKLAQGKIPSYEIENRYIKKDGSVVWVNSTVSRLPGATPEQDNFVTVVEDTSARRFAESALSMLNAELENRIGQRTLELQASNQRWQEHSDLLARTAEFIGMLPSAQDEAEACRMAAMYMPRIFPGTSGTLLLLDQQKSQLGTHAVWGRPAEHRPAFAADACWGLRRRQPYLVVEGNPAPACKHVEQHIAGRGMVCMPMIALDLTVGILNLEWERACNPPEGQVIDPTPDLVMLRTASEQLTLALANLRLRAKLESMAMKDELTGLHNRRHLDEFLHRAMAVARREKHPVAVMIVDIDHFKRFNDDFGHDAGDLVLVQVAKVLAHSVREGDLPFRYGGEEFVVVVHNATEPAAQICAERIMRGIQGLQLTHSGRALPPITASIGLAIYPENGLRQEELLTAADAALYEAKRSGRNRMLRTKTVTLQRP